MPMKVTKTVVWAGEIKDQAGGLADMLDVLAGAGVDLDCVIARRQPDKPGSGVAFVTPIKGKKAEQAAATFGMMEGKNIRTLRVEGPNKQGMGARMARAVAEAAVSMRGVSALVLGNKFVAFLGFDTSEDADKAAKAIKALDKQARPARRPKPRARSRSRR